MKRPKTTLILTWLMVVYCYLPVYAEAPVESVRRKAPASGQKLTVGDRLTKLERQQKSNNIKSLIDRLDQLEGHMATLEGSKNNFLTSPKVSIEQIEPLSSKLEDDQSLSNALKEIKQLQEEIKKQNQIIQEMKSN